MPKAELPWYPKLKGLVAPTDKAATITLGAIVVATLIVMFRGNTALKTLWAVYLVSP